MAIIRKRHADAMKEPPTADDLHADPDAFRQRSKHRKKSQ
jgi:hypothetical protein